MAVPGIQRPFSLAAAALWTSMLLLLERVCFDTTEAARPGAITDVVSVTGCVVLATSVIVFAMVRVHAPDASLRETLGVRPVGPLRLLLSIAAGAGLCPLLSTAGDLIARRWPDDDPEAAGMMEKLLSSSTHLGLVLCMLVIIPLAREVFFRGVLFNELDRHRDRRDEGSPVVPVLATALLFTAFSLDWRSMPTTLVLGLALGWLRTRSGSLVAPAIAHLSFWSVQGIPILRGMDPAADFTYPTRWIAGGLAISLLALVAFFPERPAQREQRDPR